MLSLTGTALVRCVEDPVRSPLGFGREVTKNVVALSGGYPHWCIDPTHVAGVRAAGMEVASRGAVGQRRWPAWDVFEGFAEIAVESGN